MDFGLVRVFDAILQAAGWKIAITVLVLVLVLLAAVRMLPGWLQEQRERRQAARDQKAQDNAMVRQDRDALLARIDRKDAVLEKLTGNHIQHLEIQLAKSTEFYTAAVEALRSIVAEEREIRSHIRDVETKLDQVRDIAIEIKGGMS